MRYELLCAARNLIIDIDAVLIAQLLKTYSPFQKQQGRQLGGPQSA
jgi:hypothetical protein